MTVNSARIVGVASPDSEVWVSDRIRSAIRMARAVADTAGPRADDGMVDEAIEGIINAASVEVIRSLFMEPGFVNLSRPVIRGREAIAMGIAL